MSANGDTSGRSSARLAGLSFEGSGAEPSCLVPAVPLALVEALQAETPNHQPERCVPARGFTGLCLACQQSVHERVGAFALRDGKSVAYHVLQALLTGLARQEARLTL